MVGASLSLRSHYLLRHDRELVVHSFEVIRAADQVMIGSLDAETGQRGFVITDNPDFLVPYAQATTEAIPAALKQLMSLVGDNAKQLALIYTLKEVTDPKLEELKLTDRTHPRTPRILRGTISRRRAQRQGCDGPHPSGYPPDQAVRRATAIRSID